jgi:hypothetical protein
MDIDKDKVSDKKTKIKQIIGLIFSGILIILWIFQDYYNIQQLKLLIPVWALASYFISLIPKDWYMSKKIAFIFVFSLLIVAYSLFFNNDMAIYIGAIIFGTTLGISHRSKINEKKSIKRNN